MNLFQRLTSLKILFIDDNQAIRDCLQAAFQLNGCLLNTVESAEKGLRVLGEEQFDIIISDLQLPGIDGVEFFKRAIVSHPTTIRVLISGYGNDTIIREALEIGVHAFIAKPFDLKQLVEQLTVLIEKHNGSQNRFFDTPRQRPQRQSEQNP
ncbi:MAG: response regulator [Desulfobacteraceae bacterium]|nr:response regulator [Desulfobacteraceae bacterium]